MKKDIETLIAEERADIILKYATVSLCFTENSVERLRVAVGNMCYV